MSRPLVAGGEAGGKGVRTGEKPGVKAGRQDGPLPWIGTGLFIMNSFLMSCSQRQKSSGSPPQTFCPTSGERSPLWLNLRRRKRLRYRPGGEAWGRVGKHRGTLEGSVGWSGAAQSPSRLQSDGQPSPSPSPATSGEGKRHPCLSRHRGSGPALTGAAGLSAPAMSSPGLGPAPGRARGQSRGLHVCISRCAVLTPREELPPGGDAGEIPSSSRQSGPITVPGAPAAPPPSSSGTEDPSLALVYTAENNQGQRKGSYSGLIILFYFSLVYFILLYSVLWYFILFTKGNPFFKFV